MRVGSEHFLNELWHAKTTLLQRVATTHITVHLIFLHIKNITQQ
jgi:hypothetical protein